MPLPRASTRRTNRTLLVVLAGVYATGIGSEATGAAAGWPVAAAHGALGLLVVLLVPWKRRVVATGLRRRRATRWLALLLAVLTLGTLGLGIAASTGALRTVAGETVLWAHIAGALALSPLLIWHMVVRRRRVRRASLRPDLSRRAFLRAGTLSAAAAGSYLAVEALVDVTGLPGTDRRFTGSQELGSGDPTAMPTTSWLNDVAPAADDSWTVTVADAGGRRRVGLGELRRAGVTRRETLDCTSGWFTTQEWTGVPLAALVGDLGDARSVLVRSETGYAIRFPLRELDRLLLATDVGGRPLSTGHGAPVRLVAPGHRGYWWVKWVVSVELERFPAWWQLPFPLT